MTEKERTEQEQRDQAGGCVWGLLCLVLPGGVYLWKAPVWGEVQATIVAVLILSIVVALFYTE